MDFVCHPVSPTTVAPLEEETFHLQIYNGDHYALHLELEDTPSCMSDGMRRIAIATANVFVLVYSTSDLNSFCKAIRMCEEIINQRGKDDPPIVLVGNKTDISKQSGSTGNPIIPIDEVKAHIARLGIHVVEVSAKESLNITEVIYAILRLCDAMPDLFLLSRRRPEGWLSNVMNVVTCCFPQLIPQTAYPTLNRSRQCAKSAGIF